MIITNQNIVLLLLTLLTGLTAGLCFTWTNAVTPGIGKLDDLTFLKAFQEMNRSIINPTFLIVFFGPFITHLLNLYLNRNVSQNVYGVYIIATIVFAFGVVAVTLFKNIPLNEMLDQTDLEITSKTDLIELRAAFETPWERWHMIRTLSAFLSFVLVLIPQFLVQKP